MLKHMGKLYTITVIFLFFFWAILFFIEKNIGTPKDYFE